LAQVKARLRSYDPCPSGIVHDCAPDARPVRDDGYESENLSPRYSYSQHKNNGGNKLAWILIPINVGVLIAVIAWVVQSNIALQIQVSRIEGRVDALIDYVRRTP
jgi:hypothetical protein